WWLSDDFLVPRKFRIPADTSIPAGAYLVFTSDRFAMGEVPFSPGSSTDEICLSEADGGGVPTGHRSQVSVEAVAAGMSSGRVTAGGLKNGGGGSESWPQSAASAGAPNAPPWVPPVIINEIMYHPVDGPGGAD